MKLEGEVKGKDKIEFTLRALKAMQVYCERRLAKDPEPVMYQDERVKGFALSLITEQQCMILGCNCGPRDLSRIAASILVTLKEDMTNDQFYALLMGIHAAAVDDEKPAEMFLCKKEKRSDTHG